MQQVVVRGNGHAEANISQSLDIIWSYIVLFLITKVSLVVVFINTDVFVYDLVPLLAA